MRGVHAFAPSPFRRIRSQDSHSREMIVSLFGRLRQADTRRSSTWMKPSRLASRPELLRVLDRPEIPLHTNGSENDIRAQVIRRKVSGGTRSDMGRDCRDVFLSLMKTCQKLGVSFWDYLGTRLAVPDQPAIPYLPDLVRTCFRPA